MERREFTLAEVSGPKNAMGYPESSTKASLKDVSTETRAKKTVRKASR